MIDARLAGEQRPVPRIFGRPFELKPGLGLSQAQLVQRLNDVGYAERRDAEAPGEFGVSRHDGHGHAARAARPDSRRSSAWTSHAPTRPVIARLDRRRRQAASSASRSRRRCSPPSRRANAADTCRSRASRVSMIDAVLDDRGSPLLRPSRRRSRSASLRAFVTNLSRRPAVPRRRQHAHAADRQEHVPDAGADACAASCRNSSWRSCSSRASPRTRSSSCI